MKTKPQLVLDLAGVLVTNLSATFWQELALSAGTTYQILIEQISTIRKDLWIGKMKEDHFWIWLNTRYPNTNKDVAYELLKRTMEPMPAMHCLERWSRIADIHLLSNHCKEWIEPVLTRIEKYTKSVTISNQVGYCKPQHQIYEWVETHFEHRDVIIFVDDQEKNLKPAIEFGCRTLLADEQNRWIKEIEALLM